MGSVVYRKGDVIRFRRGNSEYLGKIHHAPRALKGCIVTVEDGPEEGQGAWTVRWNSIIRIEVPVLTEKERAALLEVAPENRGAMLASLNGLRRGRREPLISGTTMHGLAERGLVVGERIGVATTSGPMQWRVTEEGRRVARAL